MTRSRPGRDVQQLLFGWSNIRRRHAVVAHSMGTTNVDTWESRLDSHVRLEPMQGSETPRTALAFVDLGEGVTAVVHRSDIGHSEGRANTHVLLGHSDTLDFDLALALERWDGWRTDVHEGAQLEVLDAEDLRRTLGPLDWRSEAERVEPVVSKVLSRLLHAPGTPLSVIGCPQDSQLPLVWCLREAARNKLRSWSFSTYENRHEDSIKYLPEVVFLPDRPYGGVATRTIVDLSKDLQIDPMAAQLVAHVLRGAPLPRPGTTSRREPEQAVVRQESHRGPDISAALADSLLDAADTNMLLKALHQLTGRDPGERARLRRRVNIPAINRITALMEFTVLNELHQALLRGLYGPKLEDLRDAAALRHLEDVTENGDSGVWAQVAGYEAKEYPAVAQVATRRLVIGSRRPPRDSLGPLRRTANRLNKRWVPASLLALVALLALGATLWLGIRLGSSSAQQATADQPATQPAVSETQSTQQQAIGVVTLAATPAADRVVYGFVRVGESYYPQQPCSAADQTGVNWKCDRTGTPPPRNGVKPALLAVVVLRSELERFNEVSQSDSAVTRGADWGESVVVPAG